MNSVRCVNCSLVNFAESSECKRCGAPLGSAEGNEGQAQALAQSESYSGPTYASASGYSGQYQSYFEDSSASSGSRQGKTIGVVLIALICLVAVIGVPWYLSRKSELATLEWREYKPDDGAFSILMPGEPKRNSASRTTRSGTNYMTMYTYATEGGTAFAIGYVQYPSVSPNAPVELLFDEAIDSMSGQGQIAILSRKNVTLDGHQAVELEVKPPESANRSGDKGVFRLYWAPPRMYIIGVGGPDSHEASATRMKYLDSFKVNNNR